MTNPNTPELLSESALKDIEAAQVKRRESLAFHQGEYPGLPSPSYIDEIDALCQTVRALRQTERPTRQVLETYLTDGEQSPPGLHDLAHIVTERLYSENAALREQLAQSEREWKAFENLAKRIESDLRQQLAQVIRERDDYRDQLVEAKAEMAERLAQVEKGKISPTTPLLRKIVEMADIGSAEEFGDALERLRAVRGLIVGENV